MTGMDRPGGQIKKDVAVFGTKQTSPRNRGLSALREKRIPVFIIRMFVPDPCGHCPMRTLSHVDVAAVADTWNNSKRPGYSHGDLTIARRTYARWQPTKASAKAAASLPLQFFFA
jgi:hypothetical protein